MTDERKQYLASISKEEYFIREEIKGCKHLIRILKDCIGIASCESVANLHKRDISKYKTIIKSLKKQLPASLEQCFDERIHYIGCSVCKFQAQPYYAHCPCCGQKLR